MLKKDFAVSHDIAAEFVNKLMRRVKGMAGETAADEHSDDPDFALKNSCFHSINRCSANAA